MWTFTYPLAALCRNHAVVVLADFFLGFSYLFKYLYLFLVCPSAEVDFSIAACGLLMSCRYHLLHSVIHWVVFLSICFSSEIVLLQVAYACFVFTFVTVCSHPCRRLIDWTSIFCLLYSFIYNVVCLSGYFVLLDLWFTAFGILLSCNVCVNWQYITHVDVNCVSVSATLSIHGAFTVEYAQILLHYNNRTTVEAEETSFLLPAFTSVSICYVNQFDHTYYFVYVFSVLTLLGGYWRGHPPRERGFAAAIIGLQGDMLGLSWICSNPSELGWLNKKKQN